MGDIYQAVMMGIAPALYLRLEERGIMRCDSNASSKIASSRRLLYTLVITAAILVLISAVRFQAPELLGQQKILTDFDAFYIAGSMAGDGRASDTYHMRTLIEAQRAISGTQSFMPWTYPLPFTLLMHGLASVPIGVAFALFTITSFAFYIRILHLIAGKWLPGTLIAIMPTVVLNLRTGQNGFLTAGLIGWFLLALQNNRPVAGIPLGLMVIKPHLALGIALATVLKRQWATVLTACIVALAFLVLASWTYGLETWVAFLEGVKEAGEFLAKGYYPFFRMSSIYAAAYTMGLGATLAMLLQVVGAVVALTILGSACISNLPYRHLAAITCGASLFISPYGYDYDLTILGVVLAFIMPDLLARCSTGKLAMLLALTWFVCGFGIAWNTIRSLVRSEVIVDLDASNAGLALISPGLMALCWATAQIMRKHEVRR